MLDTKSLAHIFYSLDILNTLLYFWYEVLLSKILMIIYLILNSYAFFLLFSPWILKEFVLFSLKLSDFTRIYLGGSHSGSVISGTWCALSVWVALGSFSFIVNITVIFEEIRALAQVILFVFRLQLF